MTMTASEFRRKLRQGDAFPTRVLKEPLILLIGGEDELGEIAGEETFSSN
jgi:hypothetical protein